MTRPLLRGNRLWSSTPGQTTALDNYATNSKPCRQARGSHSDIPKKQSDSTPLVDPFYIRIFCYALRTTGRFEEAVSAYKKAIQIAPDNISAHLGLAATYSMMGREKEARAEAAEVLRINPKFSLDYKAKTLPYKEQSARDNLLNAFRKAGLK